jgi:peptidyl-prolyl cis-trans isomerase C
MVFNLYRNLFFLLVYSLLWILSSCGAGPADEEAVITIGDTPISRKEVLGEIDRIKYDIGISDQEIKKGIKPIINRIVQKKLILEYGKKEGISVSADELSSAVNAIKQDYPGEMLNEVLLKRYIDIREWEKNLHDELLIKKIVDIALSSGMKMVTLEEAKAYYESHQDDFMEPRRLMVRQIVTRTREEIDNVSSLLNKGEKMSDLAKKYSMAPDAENGGILGWFARGEFDETIENVVFSLKIGEVSKAIESPYGFHIFELISIKEEGLRAFPETIKEIEAKITMEKKEIMYTKWLDNLKMQFPVNIKEAQILVDMKTEE